MSAAAVKKATGSVRSRIGIVAALSLSIGVVPSILAAPAHASETRSASISTAAPAQVIQSHSTCSVTAHTPNWFWKWENFKWVKKVNYRISVYCLEGMYVEMKQARYEHDAFWNQPLGSSSWGPRYLQPNKVYTFDSIHNAVNTDAGNEQVFHRVTFRDLHGTWSPWKTLTSAQASIPV